MKKAIILSIPHSGTHFMMHLCHNIIGADAEYAHFQPSWEGIIRNRLEKFDPHTEQIVIPYRPEHEIKRTWKTRLDQKGADWWGSRLEEYRTCWDVKAEMTKLLNRCGFLFFPIDKSPMRWAYCELLRERLLGGISDVEGYHFIEVWPPAKSWDADSRTWRESPFYDMKVMKDLMGTSMLKEK